jgi:hypothetical protein
VIDVIHQDDAKTPSQCNQSQPPAFGSTHLE